ncbi:putative 2 TPR domains at N-terminus [Cryptosporidium bovis]|uniref:putative 2 TPR domains at N-terminus n=1 Tax=Cryptosporidium bovis TaxID=310047 RepID=UPI003519EE80|nr:putative 2 TPR domains at N-terminus [Cryptosporidium bovis]
MGNGNIEETVCNLMKQLEIGNVSAIESTLKGIDPELVKHSINRFIDEGRNEFGRGRYLEAINSFSQAISGYKLQLNSKKQELQYENSENKKNDNIKLELAKLLSNRSQCYIKLGGEENYIKAFDDAKECILLDPNWSKGWYRAGKALYNLKIYDKAIIVFKASLKREKKASESISINSSIQEIEKLIEICEKKADHDAAIRRVTVDYSRFEEAIKKLEDEELRENTNFNSDPNNATDNNNIINLPNNFNTSLVGNNSSNQGESFQLELSPDLTKEEIDNIKMSFGGLSLNEEKDMKKKDSLKKLNKMVFNTNLKSKLTIINGDYDDTIKGVSRLVQISSEIQWFKRITENFVDKSSIYMWDWIKAIEIEIEKINMHKLSNSTTLFIGSGSFLFPIYFYKNVNKIDHLFTITQAKSNSSCIFRLYNNISTVNKVNILNLNPFSHDFMINIESSSSSDNSLNSEEASEINNINNDDKIIKLIHGNIQNLPQEFWKKINPSTIIIDPIVFEPGLLGYGLISNLLSIYCDKDIKNKVSVNPSKIKVYIQFANINIPSIKIEEYNNKQKSSNNNISYPELNLDKLNQGLWSPYWEPLNISKAKYHISFISDKVELGIFPLEKIINECSVDYFELNPELSESNDFYSIDEFTTTKNDDMNVYKGKIEYNIKPKESINSIVLSYKAIKETSEHGSKKEIILIDTSSELNNYENESVIPPGIQWIGGIITNNNSNSGKIKFDFQIETTRIVITPDIDQVNSNRDLNSPNNENNINVQTIPNKFTCSLPRSVVEYLWDIKSINMWSKVLINKYKMSICTNTSGKVFEGIITSTSPGFFIPMTLLYISSKLNSSSNNSLFNTWKKSDVHFTCIENLPNLQKLYTKVLKDNMFILLSDTVENEVRSLYNHNLNDSVNNNKYKNWKPISNMNMNDDDESVNNIEMENVKFKKWVLSDSSSKYILNKKLNEKLTFINGDVRQLIPQTCTSMTNISQSGIQHHIINEKARIFTGMNFDHDGLGEGIIPLWATAMQNGIVRKYNNKTLNEPIPKKISFYGFLSQIGSEPNREIGINISFWDTYRFEGNMQWVPINDTKSTPIIQRSDIFHIITIDFTTEGFKNLVDWKKEISFKVIKEGRVNSIIIFFDLWLDDFNILTTIPLSVVEDNNCYIRPDLSVSEKELINNGYCFHKTSFWKPTYHMLPQQNSQVNDKIDLEFSLESNFTKLKFAINSQNFDNENQDDNTPSTITSEDVENSSLVLPPLGDITYLQLRERYNSIVKEISPTLYSTDTQVSLEAFNTSLNLALNPSFYTGKNSIMKDDMLFDIDSLIWLCQSFLL